MIVEDDPDIRAALGLCLGSEGYRVETCADGLEAMTRLEAGARPQAIVLDLMMPRMNGFEVLKALEAQPKWRQIPVVIISANRGYSAEDLGVSTILRKPFELGELIQALRSAARGPPDARSSA